VITNEKVSVDGDEFTVLRAQRPEVARELTLTHPVAALAVL